MVDESSADKPILTSKGSERKAPFGVFNFTFLDSPAYQNSAVRGEINQLDLPDFFIAEAEKVVKDLEIKKPLTITVGIPFEDEDNYIIPLLGIGARTISDHEVIFQLDPDHQDIVTNISKWQTRQIAHELNHVARGISDQTLLDALVFEGLATVYEESWGGEYLETPWGNTLRGESLKEEWQRIQKGLNLPFSNYQDWFYGENPDNPTWPGYALGKAIVKAYIGLHPDIPMKELVRKQSREILSEFNGL